MTMSKHYDPDIWRHRDYEALNADIRKQLSAALQRIAELEALLREALIKSETCGYAEGYQFEWECFHCRIQSALQENDDE
jgi:hypothetical protein